MFSFICHRVIYDPLIACHILVTCNNSDAYIENVIQRCFIRVNLNIKAIFTETSRAKMRNMIKSQL